MSKDCFISGIRLSSFLNPMHLRRLSWVKVIFLTVDETLSTVLRIGITVLFTGAVVVLGSDSYASMLLCIGSPEAVTGEMLSCIRS